MTDPIDDEKLPAASAPGAGWAIAVVMAAAALGVANIGWRILKNVSPESGKAAERRWWEGIPSWPGKN